MCRGCHPEDNKRGVSEPMSYILDALKKAERERGLSEAPTLEAIHDFPKRNHFGVWMTLGLLFLFMLIALWLFYLSGKQDARSAALKAADVSPRPIQSSTAPLSAVVPSQPISPIETPVLPLRKTVKKTDIIMLSASSGGHLNNARPDTAMRVLSSTQVDPVSSDNSENISQSKIPSRNVEAPSPVVQVKPSSLIAAVARMNMSIHLYSENKAERMVFINGKKYFEGDSLDPGIVLENITPEGAVIRSGEERVVLRPGSR
jgi:general secretion pathway protein B